jgi:hypothetical protein
MITFPDVFKKRFPNEVPGDRIDYQIMELILILILIEIEIQLSPEDK